MFNFLKSKSTTKANNNSNASSVSGLRHRLKKTRQQFYGRLSTLFSSKKAIDQELLTELENLLLASDVGIDVTEAILKQLTTEATRNRLTDSQALLEILQTTLIQLLTPCEQPLMLDKATPYVLLMIGVNGAGKTTSIAKLAHYYQKQGNKILLAAGDTFRAAAIEQLQAWGQRNQVPVIAQQPGADSASVIFDAVQAAESRDVNLLIADTAGRLHTQENLMSELQKIKRVIAKQLPDAPHEVMLVIDASTGQNALHQAEQFHQAIGVTGITVTKLDGTARGGMLFAIAKKMQLPIRFIGIGEQIDDLKPFCAKAYVNALFDKAADERSIA